VELIVKMNNNFIADGPQRFLRGQKNLPSTEDIQKKYAVKLAQAAPAEKPAIHDQMATELLRREQALNHQPSPGTLW
jgi:hypothetical protein